MKLCKLVILATLLSGSSGVPVGNERKGSSTSEHRLNSPTTPSPNTTSKKTIVLSNSAYNLSNQNEVKDLPRD